MRYFFHVECDEQVFDDENGAYFHSREDSVEHAGRIASELRHDDDHYLDWAVRVINEQREEVAFVPVRAGNSSSSLAGISG